jgi:hypothetical protein
MRSMKACLMSLILGVLEGRVIDQDLDGVRAPIHNALHRNVRQQVGQAAGLGVVVSAQLIGQQQAGVAAARQARFQAELGVEQNGAGMRRQHPGDGRLELAHHFGRDLFLIHAARRRQGLLQTAALIHGRRRDDAGLVRKRLHVLQLTFGHFHYKSPSIGGIKVVTR